MIFTCDNSSDGDCVVRMYKWRSSLCGVAMESRLGDNSVMLLLSSAYCYNWSPRISKLKHFKTKYVQYERIPLFPHLSRDWPFTRIRFPTSGPHAELERGKTKLELSFKHFPRSIVPSHSLNENSTIIMTATTRSLESMVLQAHRAKGVRYPTTAQKDCFKTWYSYTLRKGEVRKPTPAIMQEHGKHLCDSMETSPGGRTYL